MANKKIGLYLGVNSMGGVVVTNNKITSSTRYDMSSLEDEAKVENLHEEVKWEALLNKTLRELKAEGKEVYVSLADKDFIFRSLEMPLMNRREIESSLTYEIEKYIPFKVEELMCDFNYTTFPKEKRVTISFVGMRESNFARASEIFTRLGLEPVVVEPSSLSLARVIKNIKKFSNLKNYALLDFVNTEAYLTFFYYDLPVFNRYFAVPRTEEGIDLEKFIEPIHLSFQYFQREFKAYEPDKFIVVSDSADEKLAALLKEELGKDMEMVTPMDLMNTEGLHVENLKAYGTASRDAISYKFKPVFLKRTKDQLEKGGFARKVPWRFGLISLVGGLCALFCATAFLFFNNKIATQQERINKESNELAFPDLINGLSVDEQAIILDTKSAETKILKNAPKVPEKMIYPFLVKLSKTTILPNGIWFDNFSFSSEPGKYKGNIIGYAFVGDSNKERVAINQFINNLKNNEDVKKVFSSVQMSTSQRLNIDGFDVTSFTITLE